MLVLLVLLLLLLLLASRTQNNYCNVLHIQQLLV